MPLFVVSSRFFGATTTRSPNGLNDQTIASCSTVSSRLARSHGMKLALTDNPAPPRGHPGRRGASKDRRLCVTSTSVPVAAATTANRTIADIGPIGPIQLIIDSNGTYIIKSLFLRQVPLPQIQYFT
jgi:hypothetical protein